MSEFLEKLRSIGGIVKGGTPSFSSNPRAEQLAKTSPGSMMHEIAKDPVLYKHAIGNKASDRSFKKDVEAISRNEHYQKVTSKKEEKLKKINTLKDNYRRKYGKPA